MIQEIKTSMERIYIAYDDLSKKMVTNQREYMDREEGIQKLRSAIVELSEKFSYASNFLAAAENEQKRMLDHLDNIEKELMISLQQNDSDLLARDELTNKAKELNIGICEIETKITEMQKSLLPPRDTFLANITSILNNYYESINWIEEETNRMNNILSVFVPRGL